MQKTSRLNRLLAVLVAVFMAVCCLPLNAFADEGGEEVAVTFSINGEGAKFDPSECKGELDTETYISRTMDSPSMALPKLVIDEGYVLTGWTVSGTTEQKLNADATMIEAGWAYNGYLSVTANIAKQEPTEKPLSRMTVHFVDNNLNDLAESYSLTGGDVVLPSADAAAVPEGYTLTGWTLRDYGQNLYAPGTTMTFGELATVVGDGYDKETGEVHLYFYAVLEENVTEPAEKPLSRMTVHFVDNNLNDLAESYSLTGGDVALPAADAAAVPEGYTLTGWTLRDYGQNLYAPGTTMTFGELATVVGDGYDKETGEVHLYFYAVLEENVTEPAEKPLSRMTVHFVDNNLNDLAESYSLTGGDVALPAADAVAVPEGSKLLGWTLRDYGQNLYAPGTTMTFGELATVVGDGYDKETGEVYLYFYAVYEGDTQTVGLNFYDEENHEQVCETTVELPADAIHLNTSKIELPEGYEFVETGDLAINDGWIYVGVKPIKTLRIYWAIDNGEAADFADGSADTWTQELSWKHINDEIAMPEITVKDGYVFNGWSVGGQNSEFWGPELATMTVGDKFVADEKGGIISITANIVAKTEDTGDTGATGSDSSNKNNTTTATATSANSGEEVVKADTPADPTVKVLPQTGVRVETPVVFGGMLFAALAGAGAYLFAMRKKLNETF